MKSRIMSMVKVFQDRTEKDIQEGTPKYWQTISRIVKTFKPESPFHGIEFWESQDVSSFQENNQLPKTITDGPGETVPFLKPDHYVYIKIPRFLPRRKIKDAVKEIYQELDGDYVEDIVRRDDLITRLEADRALIANDPSLSEMDKQKESDKLFMKFKEEEGTLQRRNPDQEIMKNRPPRGRQRRTRAVKISNRVHKWIWDKYQKIKREYPSEGRSHWIDVLKNECSMEHGDNERFPKVTVSDINRLTQRKPLR